VKKTAIISIVLASALALGGRLHAQSPGGPATPGKSVGRSSLQSNGQYLGQYSGQYSGQVSGQYSGQVSGQYAGGNAATQAAIEQALPPPVNSGSCGELFPTPVGTDFLLQDTQGRRC
jgi:hypothetical protein